MMDRFNHKGFPSALNHSNGSPEVRIISAVQQPLAERSINPRVTTTKHVFLPRHSQPRSQRLLGIQVPAVLGGEEASVFDAVNICYMLGWACESTGMIFAMHQIMLSIVVRHA